MLEHHLVFRQARSSCAAQIDLPIACPETTSNFQDRDGLIRRPFGEYYPCPVLVVLDRLRRHEIARPMIGFPLEVLRRAHQRHWHPGAHSADRLRHVKPCGNLEGAPGSPGGARAPRNSGHAAEHDCGRYSKSVLEELSTIHRSSLVKSLGVWRRDRRLSQINHLWQETRAFLP